MAKRFPIKLPVWHEKRPIWWATMKGTTKTTLGQNVIQARVEANDVQIEAMLSDRAKDLGISVDELKAQILADNGFSPMEDEED
jgi:predicted DsbA family dithiol-disulfide isomerase